MTTFGVIVALVCALAPIGFFLVLRSRERRPAWLIAIDVPAALALDLIVTLLLSRLVLLDIAVWTTKGLWLVLASLIFLYRTRTGWRPNWPTELSKTAVAQALAVGAIGLSLSLLMTRPCAIWDRQFHVPFLTSLRGQHAPFVTVYEPWKELHYHYGGNLLAASLQASSFGILHASHALSLVHDFCSFWFGVTTTLVLRKLGIKHTTLLALVFLAMLFASPVVPLEGEHRTWFAGYSLVNYMSLSFRPHVTVGALATLPFLAAPLIRLQTLASEETSAFDILLSLALCIPLMLIVEEFSIGTLGLGLGSVWLIFPQVFGATRRQGLCFFAGLGAAMLFGLLVMGGTVSPGAPHYPLKLVFPRSPGFYTASLPLSTWQGLRYFFSDLLPILGVLVGGIWLLSRSRDMRLVGGLAMYATITVVSVLLFSTLVYNGTGLQNHRFVTVPMLFAPLFAAVWLVPRPGARIIFTGVPELGMTLVVFLGAASGLDWLGGIANSDCRTGDVSLSFYDTNCRVETGAGLVTERARPMYFDPAIQYLYIGCRPAFMVGPVSSMDGHDLKVGKARLGMEALKEMANEPRFGIASKPITVACSSGPTSDPICARLKGTPACVHAGTMIDLCTLSPEQRRAWVN